MHRETFIFQLKAGMQAEYVRRHDEVWPEMIETLRAAGIRNYSIWLHEDKLFGYYECEDISAADAYKASSPVQEKWNAYMRDIISPLALRSAGNPPQLAFLME